MRVIRHASVGFQADHVQPPSYLLKVAGKLLELHHHIVVHQMRASQVHYHVVALFKAKLLDPPSKGDPVAKHRLPASVDLNRLIIDL